MSFNNNLLTSENGAESDNQSYTSKNKDPDIIYSYRDSRRDIDKEEGIPLRKSTAPVDHSALNALTNRSTSDDNN
jgi:hypothetical protein